MMKKGASRGLQGCFCSCTANGAPWDVYARGADAKDAARASPKGQISWPARLPSRVPSAELAEGRGIRRVTAPLASSGGRGRRKASVGRSLGKRRAERRRKIRMQKLEKKTSRRAGIECW